MSGLSGTEYMVERIILGPELPWSLVRKGVVTRGGTLCLCVCTFLKYVTTIHLRICSKFFNFRSSH